jgi:hypothetical protein
MEVRTAGGHESMLFTEFDHHGDLLGVMARVVGLSACDAPGGSLGKCSVEDLALF